MFGSDFWKIISIIKLIIEILLSVSQADLDQLRNNLHDSNGKV